MARYLPKEHGTYAELAFPLASGLLVGGWSPVGGLLGVAAVALFLAYEPAVLLMGFRGERLRAGLGPGARPRLVAWSALALLAVVLAFLAASPAVRRWLLVPGALALLALPLALRRRLKTVAGELAVAFALAALHLPVAAAGGAQGQELVGPALVWATAFALATLAVHGLKDRFRGRRSWTVTGAMALALAACAAAAVVFSTTPAVRRFAAAFLVPGVATLGLTARPVHPKHLKRVGWTLVAADTAALVVMLAA